MSSWTIAKCVMETLSDYFMWFRWILMPILLVFVLPGCVAIFFWLSSLCLYIYKLFHRKHFLNRNNRDCWAKARKNLARVWDIQGWIWHGYEVEGIENIPTDGPAIIVHYHGTVPVDVYYLIAKSILVIGRLLRVVSDRSLFKIPGWSTLLECIQATAGDYETCLNILNDGHILIIAPGGAYELQFSDSTNYKVMWKNRLGFAKLALQAKAPIIPMFTKNIREGYRNLTWGYNFRYWFYKTTRLTFAPMYGFFPVKLKTYIGKPIPYDANYTPEILAIAAANSIESMIKQNQCIPGSILAALGERF